MKDGLKDLREAVFRRCNWGPTTTPDAVEQCNGHINDALKQLSLEAPFLFFEERMRVITQPDFAPTQAGDRLAVHTNSDSKMNPWVMRRQLSTADADELWATDRSWDGLAIEIVDVNGVPHTNRIRSVWTSGGTQYLTLWDPWPYTQYGTSELDYRIYASEYYLPDDVISIKSARVVGEGVYNTLYVMAPDEAERFGIGDDRYQRGVASGAPVSLHRRGHFALPTPNTPPEPADDSAVLWSGPEPAGTFEYVFTLCHGKRDQDLTAPGPAHFEEDDPQPLGEDNVFRIPGAITSNNRHREPLWESSPSPTSAPFTSLNARIEDETPISTPAIGVVLPNIEYQLGFLTSGIRATQPYTRANAGHSGWYYRIYRRRRTADFNLYTELGTTLPGAHVPLLTKMDIQDAFYLIAEVNARMTTNVIYVDSGADIPDYSRRLRNVNGYQAIRFYPMPGARFEVEFRVVRRPAALVSENDTPPIHSEAMKVLIEYALQLQYEAIGDHQGAQAAKARYDNALGILKKRYGDLKPASALTKKRPSMVSMANGIRLQWWKVR